MMIDGGAIAEKILLGLKNQPKPKKFFAAVLVGDDPASISFLKQKEKTAAVIGIDFRLYRFPSDIKNDELREEVGKIVHHKTCGGLIVQLPLPQHLNQHYILNAVPAEKDVDVLSERALGAFCVGRSQVLPPAVGTIEEILKSQNVSPREKCVAVVGVGLLVGRPVLMWFTGSLPAAFHPAEVIALRSGSDLALLKGADLVVTGVGEVGLVKPSMLKHGAAVIDFGYDQGKGDLDDQLPATSYQQLAFYTPTPGGTGPILVAKVLENFCRLNQE